VPWTKASGPWRSSRTPQAYGKAAQLLRGQLARAVESLRAAADGLEKVTDAYVETDAQAVRTMTRGQQQ
jgi:hypothetical protein